MRWRIVVGTSAGLAGAVIWALGLAIYQPFMEPAAGELGSNNTYWPRDVRQLAILLALAGAVLICRANLRGIAAGAIGTAGWLGVDLWLDRLDVTGLPWLVVGGAAGFAAIAVVAARMSTGPPGSELVRHVTATVTVLLASVTTLVTTPWDEPVSIPSRVRVENALSALQVGLAVLFTATAIGLLAPARPRWPAPAVAAAAVAGWILAVIYVDATPLAMVVVPVLAMVAVAAVRDVSAGRLLFAGSLAGVVLFTVLIVLYTVGSAIGGAMTALAGNPPVNGADTDFSVAFAGVFLGLLLAAVSHTSTRPEPRPSRRPVRA